MFSDDAYNNKIHITAPSGGPGTLIGNWQEERTLREATGENRSVPQRHVPRSGLLQDFTRTPAVYKKGDDTFNRVCGPRLHGNEVPVSTAYGAPDRNAERVVSVGPQEMILTQGRIDVAEAEVQEEEALVTEQGNSRSFETTTGLVHCKPNELQSEKAEFGRKSFKQELLHGPPADRSLAFGNEGLDVPTHVHYSNAETITYQRVALGNERMRSDVNTSAVSGFTAFGKNSEFSKPVIQFTRGLAKDHCLNMMYSGLQTTQPLRCNGGEKARDPFSDVPSLAALKHSIHQRIATTWGVHGYVTFRQVLFGVGDQEGFVHKQEVVKIMREYLALGVEEAKHVELEVYLDQLATIKKNEIRISELVSSIRPTLTQKQKGHLATAFSTQRSKDGEVSLGNWLNCIQDDELRRTIAAAFGAADESQLESVTLKEPVFTELLADLSPFVDLESISMA